MVSTTTPIVAISQRCDRKTLYTMSNDVDAEPHCLTNGDHKYGTIRLVPIIKLSRVQQEARLELSGRHDAMLEQPQELF